MTKTKRREVRCDDCGHSQRHRGSLSHLIVVREGSSEPARLENLVRQTTEPLTTTVPGAIELADPGARPLFEAGRYGDLQSFDKQQGEGVFICVSGRTGVFYWGGSGGSEFSRALRQGLRKQKPSGVYMRDVARLGRLPGVNNKLLDTLRRNARYLDVGHQRIAMRTPLANTTFAFLHLVAQADRNAIIRKLEIGRRLKEGSF